MKKLYLLFALAAMALSMPVMAQNDDFPELADHGVALQQVIKEWHDKGLYTAGWDDNPGIRNYFVGLANAYPDDLFQMIVSRMLGLGVEDALFDYVLDEKNGYIAGTLGTETSPSVQMCYWRCNDGSRLIGEALQGYEYNMEEPDPSWTDEEAEDHIFVNLSDIAFFRILAGELIWRPVPVKQICGREYDFAFFDKIELPRQGKNIRLISEEEDGQSIITLVWDGSRFNAGK